jgi:hypothetical protein
LSGKPDLGLNKVCRLPMDHLASGWISGFWIERGAWCTGHAIPYTPGGIFGDVCGVEKPGDR